MIYIKNLQPGQLLRWVDAQSRTQSLIVLIRPVKKCKTRWQVFVIEDSDITTRRCFMDEWNFTDQLRDCYFHVAPAY